MTKLKEDWQKEATDLGIGLTKDVDGKPEDKTIDELTAEIEKARKDADNAEAKKQGPDKNAPKKKAKSKQDSIRILMPVAGRFLLPYNMDQVVKVGKGGIDAKQADELVKAKYAEKV